MGPSKRRPARRRPRGSWFDEGAAARAVRFIECLKHTKGKWAGRPFVLLAWQRKIVRDVFGWKRANGKRLYRFVYIEIPKKNGKSEFLAAVLLYMTFADGEAGPEVYIAAADKEQSKIVFETSAAMFDMEPALQRLGYRVPSTYRIVNIAMGGFYRALSSDVKSKHGFNVSAAGIDELHAHPNRQLYDVLTEGSGDAREQPLFWVITTAGTAARRDLAHGDGRGGSRSAVLVDLAGPVAGAGPRNPARRPRPGYSSSSSPSS